MIDTEQATEGIKEREKEDPPANPEGKPSQDSGTCYFTVLLQFNTKYISNASQLKTIKSTL